jgi:hypothetical protein
MALTDSAKIEDFLEHLDRQIGDLTSRSDAGASGVLEPPAEDSFVPEARVSDEEADGNAWCERSLEQLEMTVQLLNQCLENDLKELNRQRGVIAQCASAVNELKKITTQ